jgi:hypothetical protein
MIRRIVLTGVLCAPGCAMDGALVVNRPCAPCGTPRIVRGCGELPLVHPAPLPPLAPPPRVIESTPQAVEPDPTPILEATPPAPVELKPTSRWRPALTPIEP